MTTCLKCLQWHPRRQIKRQSSGGKGSWSKNRGQRSGLTDTAAAEAEDSACFIQLDTRALGVHHRLQIEGWASSASPCFCNHPLPGHIAYCCLTSIVMHFCVAKQWQKEFWALGEPFCQLLPVGQFSIQWPVCTEDTYLWSFTNNFFRKNTNSQANKQLTTHPHKMCLLLEISFSTKH